MKRTIELCYLLLAALICAWCLSLTVGCATIAQQLEGPATDALKKLSTLPVGPLESAEKLEQLRFLQHQMRIKVNETQSEVIGIDTAEDLEKAEKLIKKRGV